MKKNNRVWEEYQNTQNYLECQLVSALNAYYYLTGNTIKIGTDGYEELVDLSGGRNQPCLCMSPVYERLGICVKKTYNSLEELRNNLVFPLEKVVHGAIHSVLIVDWNLDKKLLRVTNFGVNNSSGWVSEEIFLKSTQIIDNNYGRYKLFGLLSD